MNVSSAERQCQRVALRRLSIHPLAIEPLQAFVRLPKVAVTRHKLMAFTGLFAPVSVLGAEQGDRLFVVGNLAAYVHACWQELDTDTVFTDVLVVEQTRREIERQLDLEILRAIDQGQYRGEADAFEALREALSDRAHHALFGCKRPSARAKAQISGLPEEDFLHRPSPVAALRIWDKICKASRPGNSNGRPS